MTVDEPAVGGHVVDRAAPEACPRNSATAPGLVGEPFLTVAEVARRMRVSKMTVYRLVHGGELPAIRMGRTFRVQRRAVEDLVEAARYRAG